MKYKFNEKELFALFVDTEKDLQPNFKAPYLKDGYVHATNGKIIIKIKSDTLNGEYVQTDKMKLQWPNENIDYLITYKEIETALSSVPQVEEEIKTGKDVVCTECEGFGTVYWEYTDRNGFTHEAEYDCPCCSGDGFAEKARTKKTGRMIPDWTAAIGILNSSFRVDNIQKLLDAMKIIGVTEIHLVAQINHRSVFRFDDNIEIMIMGYLRDNDYEIKINGL